MFSQGRKVIFGSSFAYNPEDYPSKLVGDKLT
jgi:hypothetical protein